MNKIKPVIVVTLASVIFALVVILTIQNAPKIDYNFVDKEVVVLEGDSSQTVSDSINIVLYPYGNRVDLINVTGFLYTLDFNRTTGVYDVNELPTEVYNGISLVVNVDGKNYDVGSFTNETLIFSFFKADFLPVYNMTEINFTFSYHFPAVTCHCQDQHYKYVFKPNFRFAHIE